MIVTVFSLAGSLVFALLAIVVVVGAWRRTRRVPCVACGLSISPREAECPFCYADQP